MRQRARGDLSRIVTFLIVDKDGMDNGRTSLRRPRSLERASLGVGQNPRAGPDDVVVGRAETLNPTH